MTSMKFALIAMSLLSGVVSAQSTIPAGPIDVCGIVIDSQPPGCFLVEDADGNVYFPDNAGGGPPVGTLVNVTGDFDPSCFSICFAQDGCIFGAIITLGGCELGTNFCMSTANSTGSPAVISATGSDSVSANDLVLETSPVPNEPGIVYYGPNELAAIPFGNGFRCVGGTVFRLPPVLATGNALTYPLDNASLPAGGDFVSGATWKFQAWFRDPAAGGAGFDLSDGISITFTI